jgi:hypothetical protein
MIPYGLLIKIGIGLLSVFLLISGVKTAGTLWGNMWTKHDNEVKEKLADKQNLAYQTARAEEMEKTVALVKQYEAEKATIRTEYDQKIQASDAKYEKAISKDITGRLEELESDYKDFNERAKRASIRELAKKRELSDLSTVD